MTLSGAFLLASATVISVASAGHKGFSGLGGECDSPFSLCKDWFNAIVASIVGLVIASIFACCVWSWRKRFDENKEKKRKLIETFYEKYDEKVKNSGMGYGKVGSKEFPHNKHKRTTAEKMPTDIWDAEHYSEGRLTTRDYSEYWVCDRCYKKNWNRTIEFERNEEHDLDICLKCVKELKIMHNSPSEKEGEGNPLLCGRGRYTNNQTCEIM